MIQSNINLPENESYHILRNGEYEPIGPYSYRELVEMIKSNLVTSFDYMFFKEWSGWRRLSEVFNLNQEVPVGFCQDGQEPDMAAEAFKFINERALKEEELYYIAVQHLPALSLTAAVRLTMPKSIILTNHRICILKPKLGGKMEFEEFPISYIEDTIRRSKSQSKTGCFTIVLRSGKWFEVSKIPIPQLNELKRLSRMLLS